MLRTLALLASCGLVLGLGAGCGSDEEDQGAIGEVCDNGTTCAEGLFCYTKTGSELKGLCTANCTFSNGVDSCSKSWSNTSCLVAGVCGRDCGNGLSCPGSKCDTGYGVCVHP